MNEPSKYFEGNPCRLGHTLRYVKNKRCVECHRNVALLAKEEVKKARTQGAKPKKSKGRIYSPTDFQHRVTVLGNPNRTF
jgi:hypothetical protein